MNIRKKLVSAALTAFFAAFLVSGCMDNASTTAPTVEVQAPTIQPANASISSDILEFLQSWLGAYLQNRTISVFVDSTTRDTSYMFTYKVDKFAEALGSHGTSLAVRKTVVERAMFRADSMAKANRAAGKSAQTRWYMSGMDVKSLNEVHQIKVYFEVSGGSKMKPNWLVAVKDAMNRWNNAPGTQVSFVEIGNSADADIIIKCALILDGSGVAAWLTPDPWVEKDSVELYFNLGYETTIPASQKTAYAMVGLGNILNITHTGNEGNTWVGGGVFINIAGTPYSDPSSALLPQIGPSSPITFSPNDLRAIQQMYPVWAGLARNYWGELIGSGQDAPMTIASNVNTFEFESDTLYFLKNDGSLWRRIGTTGTNSQIWATSSGALSSFAVSNGFLAVQKASNGAIYTRKPNSSTWTLQNPPAGTSGTGQYKIAGERLEVYYPAVNKIYSKWLVSSPSAWGLDWITTNLTDFAVQGNRLVVVDNGTVWGMDGYNGWVYLWNSADGYIQKVILSETDIAIFADRSGYYDLFVKSGLNGLWYQYGSPGNLNGADVCGDKLAVVNYDGSLFVRDAGLWTSNSLYTISPSPTSTVRLSGPMCDYVTQLDIYGNIWAKYSTTTDPAFVFYNSEIGSLWQR